MKHETYSQEEVLKKLNALKKEMNSLLVIKKRNDKLISEKKELIKYWEELNLNQYKAF